jgi:predicted amidophosphoribosyltransferase
MASFKCPKCQAPASGASDFCPQCGARWNVECSKCGKSWRFFYQHKFCPRCGEPVAKQGAKTEGAQVKHGKA